VEKSNKKIFTEILAAKKHEDQVSHKETQKGTKINKSALRGKSYLRQTLALR
jgi:hypothetical protein